MLKSHAASGMNRDKTGKIKTLVFGDVIRSRISSQALKRAYRLSGELRDMVGNRISIRTRTLPSYAAARLVSSGLSPDDVELILAALRKFGGHQDNKNPALTNQVIAYSSTLEMDGVIDQLLDKIEILRAHGPDVVVSAGGEGDDDGAPKGKGKAKGKAEGKIHLTAVDVKPAVDLALFGRFSTSEALQRFDGAAYFSHAFSVNERHTDSVDFFSTVDDLDMYNRSGMVGEREFDAPIHYHYCAVDLVILAENLRGDQALAAATVSGLIQAMMVVSPSGSQNSMASMTFTEHMMVEVSDGKRARTLANAFLSPVTTAYEEAGERKKSTLSLADIAWRNMIYHVEKLDRMYPDLIQRMIFTAGTSSRIFIDDVEDAIDAQYRA